MALYTTIIVFILVAYLAVTRHDIQRPLSDVRLERPAAVNDDVVGR